MTEIRNLNALVTCQVQWLCKLFTKKEEEGITVPNLSLMVAFQRVCWHLNGEVILVGDSKPYLDGFYF